MPRRASRRPPSASACPDRVLRPISEMPWPWEQPKALEPEPFVAEAWQKYAVIVGYAVSSFLLYSIFKGLFARNRAGAGAAVAKEDRDGSGRLVSLFHCTIVSITSLYAVTTSSPLDFTDANGLERSLRTAQSSCVAWRHVVCLLLAGTPPPSSWATPIATSPA